MFLIGAEPNERRGSNVLLVLFNYLYLYLSPLQKVTKDTAKVTKCNLNCPCFKRKGLESRAAAISQRNRLRRQHKFGDVRIEASMRRVIVNC